MNEVRVTLSQKNLNSLLNMGKLISEEGVYLNNHRRERYLTFEAAAHVSMFRVSFIVFQQMNADVLSQQS